jgi:branched-chain amino acid transport system ATP-binding protein
LRQVGISARLWIGLSIAVLAIAAQLLAGPFGHERISEIAIFAILAMSVDLLGGFCGLISLGHAAFFGIGAYAFSYFTVLLGWPPSLAIPVAVMIGAGTALLIGGFAVRTSGVFFMIVTLSASMVFYGWTFKSAIFRGTDGLAGVPRLDLSTIGLNTATPGTFSAVALTICAVVWVLLEYFVRTPLGRLLPAVRQNAERVNALGGRVFLLRLVTFVISGALAALAGSFAAQHIGLVSPEIATWFSSADVLVAVILGGLGTLVGPILGSILLIESKYLLSALTPYWFLWLGVGFIIIALYLPDGVCGRLEKLIHILRRSRPVSSAEHTSVISVSPAIEARNLNKKYGELVVIDDVSVVLEPGRRYGVIGPNGAGKTTFFNLISGETAPDSGEILIEGVDVTHTGSAARARGGLARSFQRNSLFLELTVFENLALAIAIRRGVWGVFWRPFDRFFSIRKSAEQLACIVGLEAELNSAARQLSYGSQRQLEVGLALASGPKVLLLDEPTAGTSPEETSRMSALLAGLPRSLTIIVIEHDMSVLFDFADTIIVLDYGRTIASGTPDEIRASPLVRSRYLGDVQEHHATALT